MSKDLEDSSEPPPDAGERPAEGAAAPRKVLSPAAKRALEEAAARRAAYEEKAQALKAQAEIAGRGGLDPVRYDDWEVKGLASDFS